VIAISDKHFLLEITDRRLKFSVKSHIS